MKLSINKKILINQPYFLGDIIFVMAIIQKFINDGYDVIYPVRDEYINLQKNFPTVNMIPLSKFPEYETYNSHNIIIEDDKYIAISLRHSYARTAINRHMKNKYDIVELPLETWRNIKIVRDFKTEEKLFTELGLKPNEKYNLINEFHRPFFHRTPIIVESEFRNIYMSQLSGYSLLDWIGVMENAESIHTIATSIIFPMDAINTMPEKMHIYRRYNENNGTYYDHSDYNYLLTKDYVYQ